MGAVVVVGSINVDLVIKVDHLPERGETVIGGAFVQAHGGKGGNQASAVRALGVETVMVAVVGGDDLGRQAVDDLAGRGIDVSAVGVGEAPTGVAEILVDPSGDNVIAVASGANAELTSGRVREALETANPQDALLLTNLEVPDEAVDAGSAWARSRGWTSVLNLAPWRALKEEVLGKFDIVVGNDQEIGTADEIARMLEAGVGAVVVTRGEAGADLHRAGADPITVTAFRVEAVDTTGAGDAFCGGMCAALAHGSSVEEALTWGAAAGALATRAVGARSSLADASEVQALIGADEHP